MTAPSAASAELCIILLARRAAEGREEGRERRGPGRRSPTAGGSAGSRGRCRCRPGRGAAAVPASAARLPFIHPEGSAPDVTARRGAGAGRAARGQSLPAPRRQGRGLTGGKAGPAGRGRGLRGRGGAGGAPRSTPGPGPASGGCRCRDIALSRPEALLGARKGAAGGKGGGSTQPQPCPSCR